MNRYLMISLAALSLTACAARVDTPAPATPTSTPYQSTPPTADPEGPIRPQIAAGSPLVDAVVLQGNRTLALSALAYDSAAKIATAGVRSGLIKGSALDVLSVLNQRATAALLFGYTAATAADQASAAFTLDGIVRQIRALAAP